MVSQSDFDELMSKLEGMRQLMQTEPAAALQQIDALLRDAQGVRERAEDTAFAPAIGSVCALLESLRRGVEVRVKLDACYAKAA